MPIRITHCQCFSEMLYERKIHWQFLEDELRAETEVFKEKFEAEAMFLLKEKEEMFVGQFLEFRDGEMVMLFPNTRLLPRKGEYLYCMLLPERLRDYHNWGRSTYRDLFNERYKGTECVCIWQSPAEDERFSLVGFRKVDLDFEDFLTKNNGHGAILTFAPQRPPIEYVANLQRLTEDSISQGAADIFDTEYAATDWRPTLISQSNVSGFVLNQMSFTDTMILQGPPGTGKTYMIAEVCQELCRQGKSVMVTALTNRALMEIAGKPALDDLLSEGKVMKTNMTVDEKKENGRITPIKQIMPVSGAVVLSTYFITSGFAADLSSETPFDYVIMDEASQALLAMFAAAKKMGKRNLWVGDVRQLSPIVALNEDRVARSGYQGLINGLSTLTESGSHPIYQLTSSFRFNDRAAAYTGIFYNDTLVSKKQDSPAQLADISQLTHPEGGPSLILTDMIPGDYTPESGTFIASQIVKSIYDSHPKTEVAVLTCMIKTSKALQKAMTLTVGPKSHLIVETIAKVQGLTTDVTVVLIPNVAYIYTLDPNLFNVATSRARSHTIIIADKEILKYKSMDRNVRRYIETLSKEKVSHITVDALPRQIEAQ